MNIPGTPASSERLASIVHFFADDVAKFKRELTELAAEINPQANAQPNDAHHQRVLKAFEESQVACRVFEQEHLSEPSVVKDAQAAFIKETSPWLSQSWIAHRAHTKPNGFVGDYEMLVKLYEQKTPVTGLGAYLDLCISDLPLARAVRTRLQAARDFLLKEIESRPAGAVRILDVASGPCREFVNWPVDANHPVEIVAMDTDPLALEYVTTQVCNQLPPTTTLRPVRYNALRTSVAEATIRQFGKFDVIFSIGLCDYLTDDQLVRMFAAWRDTLQEEGVMYVAFKDCEQYDHTPYQWHLDWFFYQRTRADVLRLFEQAGFDTSAMEMTRDATGIITNYIHRQPKAAHHRIDAAQSLAPNLTSTNSSIPSNG